MPGTSLREIRLPGLQGVPPVLAAPGSEWHFCTGSLLCLDIIVLFRTPLVRRFSTRSRKKRKPTCTPYPYLATRQSSPRYRGQLFIQTRSWQRVLDTPHCRWITHPYRTRTSTRTCFTSNRGNSSPCSLVSNQTSIFPLLSSPLPLDFFCFFFFFNEPTTFASKSFSGSLSGDETLWDTFLLIHLVRTRIK